MHSTVSDGWRDPDEVANLAADHGVRVMPGAVLKVILQHGVIAERDAWDSVRKAVDFMPADFYAPIPSPKEAVDAIHAAGGLAVHAHPGLVPDQDLMKEVLPMLDGLEVYTRRHKAEQIPVYEELARRYGLLMTVDRKSTRLNSSHVEISYAVFC